jgi:pimeloyl-ACP methyl ester carboxylesterase
MGSPTPVFEGPVQAGEVALFVRQFGVAGPRLVLLHGGPDWDHSYFLPYVLPLAAQCRLTLVDLRGCGRSQHFRSVERYHLDLAAEDIGHLLALLDPEPCSLLGFSYGGRIALRVAWRHPERLSRLILASTTAYDNFHTELQGWGAYQQRYPVELQAEVQALLRDPIIDPAEKTRRMAALTVQLDVYGSTALPEAKAALARIAFSGEWMQAWLAGRLAGVVHPDYGQILRELGLPVLILHGEQDMRFPVSVARKLHRAVPQSQLVVLPETGHLAHIERTGDWNNAVRAFLHTTTS